MAVTKKLKPCPNKANCVCSQSVEGDAHYIAPLRCLGSTNECQEKILSLLKGNEVFSKVSKIVEVGDGYIHAEFRSKIFHFVDDVEFLLSESDPCRIDVRSASRLGRSDFGVNRKRIEAIRTALL